MGNINLGDPNVVDNFKEVNELRRTGLFSDDELQDMYDKQVKEGKIKRNSVYGSYMIRMYDELTELKGRHNKLMSYYDNHHSQLDAIQRDLMMAQRSIMEHYIEILQARIDYETQLHSK